VPLTPELIAYIAQRAQWYVEFDFNNITADNQGDPFVITGDGVDDLDSLLIRIDANPRCEMKIEVGRQYSSFQPCTRADIVTLRQFYISFFGTVNKPGLPFQQPAYQPIPPR
jgi:hypothetical protein